MLTRPLPVSKQFKLLSLRELGYFTKDIFQDNSQNAWNLMRVPNQPPKIQILRVVLENCEK